MGRPSEGPLVIELLPAVQERLRRSGSSHSQVVETVTRAARDAGLADRGSRATRSTWRSG